MTSFDTCVIGAGGVVGSAIIRNLALRGLSVIGLEKHSGPARETSGFNSRVVHSGFHEIPGTLKAKLALAGSRLLMEYAENNGIRTLKCGMLIAVPHGAAKYGLWRECGSLWRLWWSGRTHGIPFQWIVSPSAIRNIAPVDALAGIFIPSVSVVDVLQLITSLQRDAIERGADIRYGSEVRAISKGADHYVIAANSSEFHARSFVNSAGLTATTISRLAGGPDYSVERLRGEYYELRGGIDRWGVRTLVYPAASSSSRSKGIHFGPRTDGRLFIGPNAMDVNSPPAPRSVFVDAARRFLPAVADDDLEYSCAGIRPKYTLEGGVSDFLIRLESTDPPFVNLIGIDSPGLSSSMAIAEYVGALLLSCNRLARPAA